MLDKAWVDERKEHERGLAEAVFGDANSLPRICTMVSEDDFFDDFYAAIFAIGSILHNAGKLDVVQVRHHLRKRGLLKSEVELAEFNALKGSLGCQGVWHAVELSRIVSLEKMQRLLSAELQSAQILKSSPEEIKGRIESQLSAISTRQQALWEKAGELAYRVYCKHKSHLEDPTTGLMGTSTGIEQLDKFTGGYFPQQLWQIAARSYFGKTTVALNLVSHLVRPTNGRAPVGVYFASYEMSSEELQERMFSALLGMPLANFTQGAITRDQLQTVLAGVAEFESCPLLFDEQPPDTVAGLEARLKLALQEEKELGAPLKVLVIDHIQQIPLPRNTKRHEHLAQLARDFKRLAKSLGITVVMLNQLNAQAQAEEEPTNLHFSEGKQVLESLDVSLLLHRKDESDEKMKVIISKNKKGPKAHFHLKFVGDTQQIEPWYEQSTF